MAYSIFSRRVGRSDVEITDSAGAYFQKPPVRTIDTFVFIPITVIFSCVLGFGFGYVTFCAELEIW